MIRRFCELLCGFGLLIGAQLLSCPTAAAMDPFDVVPSTKAIFDLHELYLFQGLSFSDGAEPSGSLFVTNDGTIYGTTVSGGYTGNGTVFRITPSANGYTERVLYAFGGKGDGVSPEAGVIVDRSGAIYGTTSGGGTGPCYKGFGCGAVFKLTPVRGKYVESIIYSFKGGRDGRYPVSGVVEDGSGALYGTTYNGGDGRSQGNGIVYKLENVGGSYVEKVLHRFQGGFYDGACPAGTPILDSYGNLYGTTAYGATAGTVYELTPTSIPDTYSPHILWRFQGGRDGAYPFAGLFADGKAGLVGTTYEGGVQSKACAGSGCGTVFSIDHSLLGPEERVLYRFRGGEDGANPITSVSADALGRLYGTTTYGGSRTHCRLDSLVGCGTVFQLTPSGDQFTETVAYAFKGGNEGNYPIAGVVPTPDGNVIFGGTASGGDGTSCTGSGPLAGCGTTFKLTRNP